MKRKKNKKTKRKKTVGLVECHQCHRLYEPIFSDADNKEAFCCLACEYGY